MAIHTLVEKLKRGGNGNVYVTFYCGFYSANVYAVSANGQKMVQKRHSDVYRIETTIKHDINVSITPLFYKGTYHLTPNLAAVKYLYLGR
jgi:hypothetical protein